MQLLRFELLLKVRIFFLGKVDDGCICIDILLIIVPSWRVVTLQVA